MSDAANEFEVIKVVHGALEPLDAEARTRVLTYIASRLGIDAQVVGVRVTPTKNGPDKEGKEEDFEKAAGEALTYSDFADLYAATNPRSESEKALVAGYWLQKCQGAEGFSGAAANKELTHLGHKVGSITNAINRIKNRKPSLILQLKKSGTSRQARKLYKVSHEGVKRIEEMVGE